MNTAQENSVEQVPAWKLEGLPNRPMRLVQNKIEWVSVDRLVRDDMGKIVLVPRHDRVAELISEHLGKAFESVTFLDPAFPNGRAIHSGALLDTAALQYIGSGRLSLLERRAVAAFAWMADKCYPPMKRRGKTVFPTALADLPEELQSPRLKTQMWKIFAEDKAIQVASVLEAMFPDISATVFEEGDGWYVAVDSGGGEVDDVPMLERIETILWMLSDFDVVPNENNMKTVEAGLCSDEFSEEKTFMNGWAVRAYNAYAAQQRIEDGINAILAHLGRPEAPGRESVSPAPQNASTGAGGRENKVLTPPAAKKSAPKSSKRSA